MLPYSQQQSIPLNLNQPINHLLHQINEFGIFWCEKHDTVDGIEQGFQDYLRSYAEKAYANS